MAQEPCRGRVKFFNAEKGWGGIESDDAPGDVWVYWAVIEGGPGFHELAAGEHVEFTYEAAQQDSWRYRATWVRRAAPPHATETKRKAKRRRGRG